MNDDNLKTDMLQAMRRLAKSVTIITTSNGRERFAMSATAVDSLSTEPPSLLICVNQTASLHAVLDAGADFCVNILGLEQEELSHLCSGPIKGEALPGCKVSWQNETRLRFALKNPSPGVIQRLCSSVGLQVLSLRRIRIGGVSMGKLPGGQWRYLGPGERF